MKNRIIDIIKNAESKESFEKRKAISKPLTNTLLEEIKQKIDIEIIKNIIKLSKKPISELRKLNPHWAYHGKELTKSQLIYQIVFFRDAPDKKH